MPSSLPRGSARSAAISVTSVEQAEAVDEFVAARDAEADARARARSLALLAVKRLTDTGLSTRDTGTVLGFSHQRIAQLGDELEELSDAELHRTRNDRPNASTSTRTTRKRVLLGDDAPRSAPVIESENLPEKILDSVQKPG